MLKRVFVLSFVLIVGRVPIVGAEDKVDYEKQIQPILAEACGKCHGEKQAAAKMRLHTSAALKEKWDAKKELIVAGKPEESELYKRLVLPPDDKKRMPKKPAEPLAKDKLELIARWIKEGAVLPLAAAVTPPTVEKKDEKPAEGEPKKDEKPKEPELPKVSAAPQEAIDKLTKAGAQVMPLFADSSLLTVSFAHRVEPAGDAEVAQLSGVAEQVYALNLADSKTTDAGLAPLAGLKNLSTVHLERSAVTDAGLAHLAGLANLQYLNIYGTNVTDAGLAPLKGLKKLQRLYLWETKVSYDAAMGMEKDTPGLMVNLGYNHPMVVKVRVAKELEAAKKLDEEAKQTLETAKKNADATAARLADLDKQFKEAEAAVSGKPAADAKPQTPEEKAAADKVAAEKAAADKAAADKAAADKAAADKAAADKAAADKAAADKAAADAKDKK